MNQKTGTSDALDIIADFQKNTLSQKPSIENMYEDVRMMGFKIRPIIGDILNVNMQDQVFIETLWSLGKLEELFQKVYTQLSFSQKKVFFTAFDSIHQKFQDQLSDLSLPFKREVELSAIVEMEIFKESKEKVN